MNKSIYFSAVLLACVSSLSSCKNEEELLFEDSAANRLETAKSEFTQLLSSNGGKWSMEYFSNEDEPGYVLVCTFGAGGDVAIAGNNKWLDYQFKTDTSLWEMIADNGPVLTFNSYNDVFHLFSDPADITGPYQPTNPDRDNEPINEQGYGHNGDYEFMILGTVEENQNEMRLLGKKRGFYTWLRRLPADTNDEAYLENVQSIARNMFSDQVDSLWLTDGATGEVFVVTRPEDGVFAAYPKAGDEVMQTVSQNAIITDKGLRFRVPFLIPRADESQDDYEIETLALQADGSLMAEDGSLLRAPALSHHFLCRLYSWSFDFDSASGIYATMIADAKTQIKQYRPAFTLSSLSLVYDNELGKLAMTIGISGRNSRNGVVYFDVVTDGDDSVKLSYADDDAHHDQAGGVYVKNAPALGTLISTLTSASVKFSVENVMKPEVLTCSAGDAASGTFTLAIRRR